MSTTALEATVTGIVWKIEKQVGEPVAAGEAVMILESMKMEIPVESPVDGVVQRLDVEEGASVEEGHRVAIIGPAPG